MPKGTVSVQLYWRPRKTVGILILAMKEKRLPFTVHVINQLTAKWRIQEIREIFVTFFHVGSRKYFQLFCFNSCPFFLLLKKWLGINKWGKRIKRKIQILLRFVRQLVRGVASHAMFTTK